MLKFFLIVLALLAFFYWQGSTTTTARTTVDYTGSVTDRPRPQATMTERHGAIPAERTLDPGETVVE